MTKPVSVKPYVKRNRTTIRASSPINVLQFLKFCGVDFEDFVVAIPVVAAAVAIAGCNIKDFAFGPKTLKVKKGESESVTFDKAGIYTYHCTLHPNMKATIIVE